MHYLHIVALLLGGLLGCSALIVAKRPDARRVIDALSPFQALIGVALLAISVLNFLRVGPITLLKSISATPALSLAMIGAIVAGIALGLVLGLPQILKIAPAGSPAGNKAQEIAGKLVPFQVLFGIACAVAGVLLLAIDLKIVAPH